MLSRTCSHATRTSGAESCSHEEREKFLKTPLGAMCFGLTHFVAIRARARARNAHTRARHQARADGTGWGGACRHLMACVVDSVSGVACELDSVRLR
jgi:hypothetical protein